MSLVEAAAVAAEARSLYVQAKKEGWSDKFAAALRRRHNLLLVGPSGVGKSNLLAALQNEFPQAIDILQRTVAVGKKNLRFGTSPFVIRDTPGDALKTAQRRRGYDAHIKRDRRAVLSTVAYGYHEYPAGMDGALTPTGRPSKAYLREHREVEIELMNEWSTFLDPSREKFLMTVVTKSDLWWANQAEVIEYYTSGPYAIEAERLGWRHRTVVPHCSVIHRFFDVGSVSGSFDDADRVQVRGHLLASLLRLTAEEV